MADLPSPFGYGGQYFLFLGTPFWGPAVTDLCYFCNNSLMVHTCKGIHRLVLLLLFVEHVLLREQEIRPSCVLQNLLALICRHQIEKKNQLTNLSTSTYEFPKLTVVSIAESPLTSAFNTSKSSRNQKVVIQKKQMKLQKRELAGVSIW